MLRFALLTALTIGLTTVAPAVASAAAPEAPSVDRIAVVDIQRCLLETKEGKKAKADLEKSMVRSQARIEKKGTELQKKLSDLQAKASMLSEAELRKRQEDLMRGQAELEQLTVDMQESIAEKEALLTEKIYKNVSSIVAQIAIEEKLQAVLVRSEMTIIYVDPKLDLTNRVIVRYDKEHP
jgi:outer membrane protein